MPNNQAQTKSEESTQAPKKPFFPQHHITFDEAQTNKFLRITGLILLSLLSLFVLVKTISEVKLYSVIGESGYPYTITVTGKAEIAAPKDVASVTFTSSAKGKTAAEAQSKAAEANNAALAFVRAQGILEKDITTENYNTYPTYDQKVKPCIVEERAVSSMAPSVTPIAPCSSYESVITGYETSQSIRIKIRGIDANPKLGSDIITGLAAAGVQVGNLETAIDDKDALMSQARAQAIANARAEAKQTARSLGVRLGKVSSYYENDPAARMSERGYAAPAVMDAKMVSPELPAGESMVTSEVSVTFEIEQ